MFTAGTLDTTFGGTGLVSAHPGDPAGLVMANSMTVQSNGEIIQVGQATDPTTHNTDIAVVRYTASGTLDTSFGTGGVVLTPITTGAGAPTASDVLVDSQGRIVVVGGDGSHFELLRYTSSGQLDSTFGNGGLVTTPVPGATSSGVATTVGARCRGRHHRRRQRLFEPVRVLRAAVSLLDRRHARRVVRAGGHGIRQLSHRHRHHDQQPAGRE